MSQHVLDKPLKRLTPATITTADGLTSELSSIRKQGYAISI